MKKIIFLPILALLATSCSHSNLFNEQTKTPKPQPLEISKVDKSLMLSATTISNALEVLSKTENIRTKSTSKIDYIPAGLSAQMSIDWVGPAEQAIEKIAEYSDYNITIMGTPSSITPAIAIHYKKIPLIKIIRDIAYQSRKYLDISIYEDEKIIELRYVFK
jgi:hypothetical protein